MVRFEVKFFSRKLRLIAKLAANFLVINANKY